ncbi:MAG: hypothetical protein KDK37_02265 [Leptospiraceae bacterium]|nr:hypothetical protein [Leptospiraceae bacterium]MCB1303068.1 hypothetical protein [Leptospiraceae bacterium]
MRFLTCGLFLILILLLPTCFRANLENAADPNNPDDLSAVIGIVLGGGSGLECVLDQSVLDKCNLK